MTSERDDSRLVEYLYGELSAEEARAFEDGDPSALDEARELGDVLALAREADPAVDPPPFLDAKILAAARAEATAQTEAKAARGWRRWLTGPALGGAFAAVAATMLVVLNLPLLQRPAYETASPIELRPPSAPSPSFAEGAPSGAMPTTAQPLAEAAPARDELQGLEDRAAALGQDPAALEKSAERPADKAEALARSGGEAAARGKKDEARLDEGLAYKGSGRGGGGVGGLADGMIGGNAMGGGSAASAGDAVAESRRARRESASRATDDAPARLKDEDLDAKKTEAKAKKSAVSEYAEAPAAAGPARAPANRAEADSAVARPQATAAKPVAPAAPPPAAEPSLRAAASEAEEERSAPTTAPAKVAPAKTPAQAAPVVAEAKADASDDEAVRRAQVEAALAQAEALVRAGRVDEAERGLVRALAQHRGRPTGARLGLMLGRVLADQKRWDDAQRYALDARAWAGDAGARAQADALLKRIAQR